LYNFASGLFILL